MRDETDQPYGHLTFLLGRFHPGDELRVAGKPRLAGQAIAAIPVPAAYAARRFRLHPHLLLSGVDVLNQGLAVPHPGKPDVALLLLRNHSITLVDLPNENVIGLFTPEAERAHTPAAPVNAPAPQVAAPAPATDVGPAGGAGPAPAVAGAPTTAEGGPRRRRPAADAA